MYIDIEIKNKLAILKNDKAIVNNNSNYIVRFNFDSEWDKESTKTARFTFTRNSVVEYIDVVFTGSECKIPNISQVTTIFIGVFDGDLKTTTPCKVKCDYSILDLGGVPADPSPDIYAQILSKYNELTTALEEGRLKGDKGEKGNKGDKGDKGEQGIQGIQGIQGVKGDKGDKGVDGKDAITDQTYNPKSENAQSGVAVAEAVSGKEDKKPWTLLYDLTLTEAVSEFVQSFEKRYAEIYIEGIIKFETDFDTEKTLRYVLGCRSGVSTHSDTWASISNGTTGYMRAHGHKTPTGYLVYDVVCDRWAYTSSNMRGTSGGNTLSAAKSLFDRFRILSETAGIRFGVGSNFKVWGR